MDKFKEALDGYGLHDLGFEGDVFTWRNNSHTSEHYIRERLDRAVADGDWRGRFPGYRVINGDQRHSNHRPVIVNTEDLYGGEDTHPRATFRFETGWV